MHLARIPVCAGMTVVGGQDTVDVAAPHHRYAEDVDCSRSWWAGHSRRLASKAAERCQLADYGGGIPLAGSW